MNNSDIAGYQGRVAQIDELASAVKAVVFAGQFDGAEYIQNPEQRAENMRGAAMGTIFESVSDSDTILSAWGSSLREYHNTYGEMPRDEILASSAHAAVSLIDPDKSSPIFESVQKDISSTEGINLREHMIAMVLPSNLSAITSDMCTHIPGDYDHSDIYKVERVAGTDFGDFKKGDVLDEKADGQYGYMNQRYPMAPGDGTKTVFAFDSATDGAAIKVPFKQNYVVFYQDRRAVARDNGKGQIFGTDAAGNSITGTVDYANGTASVTCTVAPAAGITHDLGYDVNIEHDPALIPSISHVIEKFEVMPHESALSAHATIQAIWNLKREFNLDSNAMALQALRNSLSYEFDRKRLRDMRYFARGLARWGVQPPSGISEQTHYEMLRKVLLMIDAILMNRTKVSGLVGIVGGTGFVNIARNLPSTMFKPAPNYRRRAQAHFVGTLFGVWRLYEDPQAPDSMKALCYARGANHSQAGYVAGQAIPPVHYNHPVLSGDMKQRDTLWQRDYNDVHPDKGEDYFFVLELVDSAASAEIVNED